jgi:predicted metal-dependent hydrolase
MAGNPKNVQRLTGIMSDVRYLAYIRYFNVDLDYFECHEVMEELWLEEGRSPILQGLLQAAVGLHHWQNDNRSGAVKLMTAALSKLDGYEDIALGLNLAALRSDLERSLKTLSAKPVDAPFEAFLLEVQDEALSDAVDAWTPEEPED